MQFPNYGLYAITQTDHKTPTAVIDDVAAALKGGAKAIQYRDKTTRDAYALACQLQALCQQYQVPFIVNDSIELAKALEADGVHLGQDDGDIATARVRLGAKAIIGVSCYNSLERAVAMQKQGATYVAFGRFFPSSSKPLAKPAELQTLVQAKQQLTIPIVAIGGILPSNALPLLQAGADVLAVISGVFDQQPEQSAKEYQALFEITTT
jgi:thiamine-phosphate pyrophosphorylase